MRDPVVQVRQQFDRARSPNDQAAARSDARPQALSKSRDDDRRHRTHASDQKGPVQTREASRSRQNRSRDLESRSCYMIRGDFQASAWLDLNVCTRAPRTIYDNIKKAADQIEASAATHGLIILNVKNLLDYDALWPSPSVSYPEQLAIDLLQA